MPILATNWDQLQTLAFNTNAQSSFNIINAIIIASVQYVVAQWIYCCSGSCTSLRKITDMPPRTYAIVPMLMMWASYSLLVSMKTFQDADTEYSSFKVAFVTVVAEGVLLNMMFFSCSKTFGWEKTPQESTLETEEEKAETAVVAVTPPSSVTTEADIENGSAEAEKSVSLHFINNIKVFLTCMMFLHSIALVNTGTDLFGYALVPDTQESWVSAAQLAVASMGASYFMPCMFFFSGYFTPGSYDKKGAYVYLFDRVKRVGIPYVVYSFVVGPYLVPTLADSLMRRAGGPVYDDHVGVHMAWMLCSLMCMHVMYAVFCGENWYPQVRYPGILKMLLLGLAMGTVVGTVTLFVPVDTMYLGTESFFQDFLYYVAFYVGGALAYRNSWLEDVRHMSWLSKMTFYGSSVVFLIGSAVVSITTSVSGSDDMDYLAHYLKSCVFHKGIAAVYWNVFVMVLFMDLMNKKYWCTEFSVKSVYGAYMLQYVGMAVGVYCWVEMLRSMGVDVALDDVSGDVYYPAEYGLGGLVLMGVVSMCVTWPLAYVGRCIPVLREVL